MLTPAVLGVTGAAADSAYVVGPLVISVSVVAVADLARSVRWLDVPLAWWLAAAPWLVGGAGGAARWKSVAAALLLAVLSIPRGRIGDRFGSFTKYIV
jgi:hypothetical protein